MIEAGGEQEGRQEAAAAVRNDDLRPHVLRTPVTHTP